MKIRVKHFDKIVNSAEAIVLGAKGFAELAVCNHINSIPLHYSYPAIVAYDEETNTPIGVLIWFDMDNQDELWVQLAYVEPEYRQRGVHRAMFEALKKKAKELKRQYIGSGISINNEAMLMAAKAEGREIIGVFTRWLCK